VCRIEAAAECCTYCLLLLYIQDGGSDTAGVVCGLALGGLVPVMWEDGSQTLCVPQEICFVASDDVSDQFKGLQH
jgi:hypothetical protein